MDIGDIDKALEGLRKGLRSDGSDLVVNNLSDDSIELSLILQEDACLECIVSNDILLVMVRRALSKVMPTVPRIVLHDPRNS